MSWASSTRKTKRRASGWTEQRDAQRILARDRRTCYRCGQPGDRVDHIVPLARGGADDDLNKAVICRPCHDKKTQAEAAAARHTQQRPPEKHPGVVA